MDSPDKSNRVTVLSQERTGRIGQSAIETRISRRNFIGKTIEAIAAFVTGAVGIGVLYGAKKMGEQRARSTPVNTGSEPSKQK